MSASSAPSERQLRYLRSLALRTATTFAAPASRTEASREIDRLRRLERAPRERGEQQPLLYATAPHEDEITGFGAETTWRSRAPATAHCVSPAPRATGVLARYALSSGERVILGARGADGLTVSDVPAAGTGAAYTVERLGSSEAERELRPLLADYLRRAGELDAVPMSGEALGSMLACEPGDA